MIECLNDACLTTIGSRRLAWIMDGFPWSVEEYSLCGVSFSISKLWVLGCIVWVWVGMVLWNWLSFILLQFERWPHVYHVSTHFYPHHSQKCSEIPQFISYSIVTHSHSLYQIHHIGRMLCDTTFKSKCHSWHCTHAVWPPCIFFRIVRLQVNGRLATKYAFCNEVCALHRIVHFTLKCAFCNQTSILQRIRHLLCSWESMHKVVIAQCTTNATEDHGHCTRFVYVQKSTFINTQCTIYLTNNTSAHVYVWVTSMV